MKREELWKIVSEGAGGSAVISRLWLNDINVEGLLTTFDLKEKLHNCVDKEAWGDASEIIEALKESFDDSIFAIDMYTSWVEIMNSADEVIEWLIENDRVEVEEDEED